MDDSGSDFQDWELLHDDTCPQFYSSMTSESKSRSSEVIEGVSDSGSIIRLDYFSLRNHEKYTKTAVESVVSEECLVESENLSSFDAGSENRDCWRNTSELRSDSGDGLLDEDQFNKSHAKTDCDRADITKSVLNFEEITTEPENLERPGSDDAILSRRVFFALDELVSAEDVKNQMASEEFGESASQDEFLNKFYSNSSGNESVTMKSVDDGNELVTMKSGDDGNESVNTTPVNHMDSVYNSNEELGGEDGRSSDKVNVAIEEVKLEAESGDDETKKRVVWWKIPFGVLKYCFLRASPAWSFSVAAAVMGIVILGRRLYKMKRKTKSFQLKIAVDDKRVSQFASRAARMNEAFSVVRRVPVVRASLTAPGVNSWPAMSMR